MEHHLKQQIAANAKYLNDYLGVLAQVQQNLSQSPHNRLLQLRVSLLEASIQIMIENIDMLRQELKSFALQ